MGRRLNLSTPTVINTELIPLDESFYIEANGNTEQWYYDNTNAYAPNRNVIPLTLTPRLSVFDGDTKTTYTPTFFMVKWYAKEYNATQGEYVETQITTTDPAATDYVLSGNNLLVKKNVPYSHDVTIRCEATYVDPRDTGVTSTIQDTVTLLTNRDASTISPMLEIDCPASQGFNPLTATTSKYTLKGRASWGQDLANDNIVTFKADPLGAENIIPTNEDSIDSAAPTLSLRYGSINQADQTFMSRQTSGGQVGSIEGGVGYVTNIKGDTVKWVQSVKREVVVGSSKGEWFAFDTGTTLSASNNILTITKSSGYGIAQYVLKANTIVSGHKYYLYAQIKTDAPANSVIVYAYGVDTLHDVTHQYNIASSDWQEIYSIRSCATNYPDSQFFRVRNEEGGNFHTVQVRNCMFIDLTLMFGSGNEPTTVTAFESWLSTHIGTKSYYPYTEGRLINYGGYQVKMNQLVENGDFSKGLAGWSTGGNTTTSVSNKIVEVYSTNGTDITNLFISKTTQNVNGHKYLLSIVAKSNVNDTQIWALYNNNTNTALYANLTTSFAKYNSIITSSRDASAITTYIDPRSATAHCYIKSFNVIDLTLMFGAGNEPDLEWCNTHFTEDYYPYHTGYDTNLLSVADEDLGIKTVGFNLWDEELKVDGNIVMSKNLISVLPSTTYYYRKTENEGGFYISEYDANKKITKTTDGNGTGGVLTTQRTTRYISFYFRNVSISYISGLDICINISNPSKNGTYEPYWESFTDMSWVSKIGIENFNIWDEEWEGGSINTTTGIDEANSSFIRSVNFMRVEASGVYYGLKPSGVAVYLYYYDGSKTFLNRADPFVTSGTGGTFTVPSGAVYMRISIAQTTYTQGVCINKSIAHFNGRYYPHGVTAPYFPNGLCNVGSVYDEIKVVDGKIKGVVRLGRICMDDTNWIADTYDYSGTTYNRFSSYIISTLKRATDGRGANFGSSLYSYTPSGYSDKIGWISSSEQRFVCVNNSYSDAATFKADMAGVPLIYELATPYEFEIDYPTKSLFEWYGISNNTEVKADTLPWYVDGQNTDTLTVDAMYGEEIRVVLRAKKNYGTDLYPSKAYRSILWRIPDIDSSVLSENGSAVRSDTESMNFGTIVNIKGDTLSDDVKKEHLRFHWKSRRDNTSTETDQGWGLTKELPASDLINTRASASSRLASTIVYPEVYLLGAYEKVTDEGNDVTEDGELVYDRPVF